MLQGCPAAQHKHRAVCCATPKSSSLGRALPTIPCQGLYAADRAAPNWNGKHRCSLLSPMLPQVGVHRNELVT